MNIEKKNEVLTELEKDKKEILSILESVKRQVTDLDILDKDDTNDCIDDLYGIVNILGYYVSQKK